VDFLLEKLRPPKRFSARAMFGEYALYADGKVVALMCDLLYVKILPASRELEAVCEKGEPYPGARPHYIVEEAQLSTLQSRPRFCVPSPSLCPRRKRGRRASVRQKEDVGEKARRRALERECPCSDDDAMSAAPCFCTRRSKQSVHGESK
jgi:hypothetical protein